MGKFGFETFTAHQFNEEFNFKSKAILFDKIFIHYSFFETVIKADVGIPKNDIERQSLYKTKHKELEFLLDNGIISEYKPAEKFAYSSLEKEMPREVADFFKLNKYFDDNENNYIPFEEVVEMHNLFMDYITRFSCAELNRQGYKQVYPLLASRASFSNQNKKQEVLSFILEQLPQPSVDTPWQQIIEFRNDHDAKLKRSALIHWMNTVASNNRPMNEVEDEYEYLYHQYKRHFELHKIKTDLTTWEMIVSAGIDVLTSMQGIPTFFKNLFSISKTRISLLEDEMKLPGQEIAYIHKANEAFK